MGRSARGQQGAVAAEHVAVLVLVAAVIAAIWTVAMPRQVEEAGNVAVDCLFRTDPDCDLVGDPTRIPDRAFERTLADLPSDTVIIGPDGEVLWAHGDPLPDDPVLRDALARLAEDGPLPGDGHQYLLTADGQLLHNSRSAWQDETYAQAGIDPDAWDPDRGLAELDGIAVDAWEFYAELFERNPDQFLWAGMATLAGGTFYAGFQDIHVLRTALESGVVTIDEARDLLREWLPGVPDVVINQLASGDRAVLAALASELEFVERTFLQMQRDIFDDLAWQHVAYDNGGIAAIEGLYQAGEIQDVHVQAWRLIDTGDPALVAEGNLGLLRHEQETIIGDNYDRIRDHSPITWALTMGMSVIAESPVPGGEPFRDVVPYEVNLNLETPGFTVGTPCSVFGRRIPCASADVPSVTIVDATLAELPINNVSIFENRWQWIEQDMVPAWLDLVDSGEVGDLVAVPIPEQAADKRMVPDWLLSYEGR